MVLLIVSVHSNVWKTFKENRLFIPSMMPFFEYELRAASDEYYSLHNVTSQYDIIQLEILETFEM